MVLFGGGRAGLGMLGRSRALWGCASERVWGTMDGVVMAIDGFVHILNLRILHAMMILVYQSGPEYVEIHHVLSGQSVTE